MSAHAMLRLLFFEFALAQISVPSFSQEPIRLHPDNSHYFLFHGKPTVLISSAEHYGAVLNEEIDYVKYLTILQQEGFNQTRMFSGVYCEGKAYDIEKEEKPAGDDRQNTLAPRPGKFITPWILKQKPAQGQRPVYDLNEWNEKYFTRLKDFLAEAAKRNVVVEIVLFTANYSPALWLNSPLNPRNNNNATGTDIPYNEIHLPQHTRLRAQQEVLVEKIVREVNAFDNLYFEICNEPYWLKGIPSENSLIKEQQFLPEIDQWQHDIGQVIRRTEHTLPKKHLIAQNIANTYKKVDTVDQAVSILNFHYAFPPATVADNYSLGKPIVFDETDKGCNAPDRRTEAWAFMLAGGAGYSNLDWSFAVDDITGLGRNPSGKRQSGKEVREQLSMLVKTINSFDFVHSTPIANKVQAAPGVHQYGLGVPGKDYLVYCLKEKKVAFDRLVIHDVPAKKYTVRSIDPIDGHTIKSETYNHKGGVLSVALPLFQDDLLVRIAD